MNEQIKNVWHTHLTETYTPEQLAAIKEYFTSDSSEAEVTIVRTPTEEAFVENPPPYVDIFNLHRLYDAVAFDSNILVKGPKGDGKSLSVITYAHKITCPIIVQECSDDSRKLDMMGSQNLVGKRTIFTLGCIPAAIDVANEFGSCILLLEEMNGLTPQVQKMLNAVTDFRKACSMPFLGRTYKLEPGRKLWVVGTMNPSIYGGTYDVNEDLKSRFEEVEVPYPKDGQEKRIIQVACSQYIGTKMPTPCIVLDGGQQREVWHLDDNIINKIIQLAAETRNGNAVGYALSTRDVVRTVAMTAKLGIKAALQLLICKYESKEDKETMIKRISSLFTSIKLVDYWS